MPWQNRFNNKFAILVSSSMSRAFGTEILLEMMIIVKTIVTMQNTAIVTVMPSHTVIPAGIRFVVATRTIIFIHHVFFVNTRIRLSLFYTVFA